MGKLSIANSVQRGKDFYQEVVSEVKKTTFPSRSETMGATGVVFVLVILLSVYLALVDMLLSRGMAIILS
ncbi:MAG: preprotein translocase subunit SecE [Leptospirales bacterium]